MQFCFLLQHLWTEDEDAEGNTSTTSSRYLFMEARNIHSTNLVRGVRSCYNSFQVQPIDSSMMMINSSRDDRRGRYLVMRVTYVNEVDD